MNVCNICGKPANAPYRSHNAAGQIVQGCVAEFHTEALTGLTLATAAWHFRKDARAVRIAAARQAKALERQAAEFDRGQARAERRTHP